MLNSDNPFDLGEREGPVVSVVCVACTGSQALSNHFGLPVVCVKTTEDIIRTVRDLNKSRHGSGVRWPHSFQPLDFESGWTDWSVVPMEGPPDNGLPPPAGVRILAGHIVVTLPAGTTAQEFEDQLAGALRHLRVQEVTIAPGYLERRNRSLADLVFHPRYTPTSCPQPDGIPDFEDCRLVTDLFALDPTDGSWRLFWMVVGARMAACDGRLPSWW